MVLPGYILQEEFDAKEINRSKKTVSEDIHGHGLVQPWSHAMLKGHCVFSCVYIYIIYMYYILYIYYIIYIIYIYYIPMLYHKY